MSTVRLLGIKIQRPCGKVEDIELEFERAELNLEHGINKPPGFGKLSRIKSNGLQRMTLKAWNGCEKFEDFEAETNWPNFEEY